VELQRRAHVRQVRVVSGPPLLFSMASRFRCSSRRR